MAEHDWEDEEKQDELYQLLYQNVEQEDFTPTELNQAVNNLGDPDYWEDVSFGINGEAEFTISIDGNTFTVGSQDEFADLYDWLQDQDIDFEILYTGE
jgi:hypothetical protein